MATKSEKKTANQNGEIEAFIEKLKDLHQREEQLIHEKLGALRLEIEQLSGRLSTEREIKEKLQKKLAEQEKKAEEEYLKRRDKEKKLEEETAALKAKQKDYEEEVAKREELEAKLSEEIAKGKEKEQQVEDERLKRKGTEKEWEEEKALREEKENEAREWQEKAEGYEKRIAELEESYAYERGVIAKETDELKKRVGGLESEKSLMESKLREYRGKEEEWGNEKKSQIEEIERQREVNSDLSSRLEQLKERTVTAINKMKEVQEQKEENWDHEREGFVKRLEEGEVKVKLLREEMESLQKRIIEQEAEKERLSQMVQKYVEAQQDREEEARTAGMSEEERADFVSEMNSAVERLKHREAEVFSLKEQVQELQGKLEILEFELKKAADFGESLLVEKDALIEEIAVLNEGSEPKMKVVEQELSVVKRENQEKTRAIQSLKNTIARLEAEREEFLQKMNSMKEEKAQVEKRLDAAWETQEDARKKLDAKPKGKVDDDSLQKAQGFFLKGKDFFQKQQYRKALTNFEEAVTLDPTKAEYYTGLGLVHSMEFSRHKIDIPKAESCFLQAIRLDPKNARNYYYLGVIYKSQGQDGKAKSYFRKAVEYQPDYPEAQEQLQLLQAG